MSFLVISKDITRVKSPKKTRHARERMVVNGVAMDGILTEEGGGENGGRKKGGSPGERDLRATVFYTARGRR